MSYTELWETNAGELALFLLEEESPLWGCTYYGGPESEACAGRDYTGLVVQGCDPMWDEWDGYDAADLMPAYLDMSRFGTLIATDRRGETHALGFDMSLCGVAGHMAAEAAGAVVTCHECSEEVSATYIPTSAAIKIPCFCYWCGARLD